ncbi:protein FAR1-RELATED SEQUENCE 5-like [Lathyrus oleraceus]|uniref:protein FAR1-RELATED SEQUENCE 5-like n=1 Tax=Pisum sativum TaxID=3888 RepID=UPI0021D266F8|nr:protein FAR1-RELATED SEQUENCE 5-like [Pisum sativum]
MIDVKYGLYNHGLPDRFEGHSFVGGLNVDDQQHIVDLTNRHVPPRHILLSLQERDLKNVIGVTQIYKHKSKMQKDTRGPRTEMQHLFKLIEDLGYVYYSRKKDESKVVRNIFWAHPESVKLLNMFPSVLIMDSTYKKNKCMQPLFEVVGKTSTELTFFVGFAYMESEKTKNFCWVLDKLKQLFTKQRLWPRVILTDRDLALMKAIETVFPRIVNLLCRFQINKNVKGKCKKVEFAHSKLKQMLKNGLGDLCKCWKVNMNEVFMFPPIRLDWKKHRTPDATSWMIGFVGWLQHWQHLTPVVLQYVRL